jgi:hypothetical protein
MSREATRDIWVRWLLADVRRTRSRDLPPDLLRDSPAALESAVSAALATLST